jgi:hypothetical protein
VTDELSEEEVRRCLRFVHGKLTEELAAHDRAQRARIAVLAALLGRVLHVGADHDHACRCFIDDKPSCPAGHLLADIKRNLGGTP